MSVHRLRPSEQTLPATPTYLPSKEREERGGGSSSFLFSHPPHVLFFSVSLFCSFSRSSSLSWTSQGHHRTGKKDQRRKSTKSGQVQKEISERTQPSYGMCRMVFYMREYKRNFGEICFLCPSEWESNQLRCLRTGSIYFFFVPLFPAAGERARGRMGKRRRTFRGSAYFSLAIYFCTPVSKERGFPPSSCFEPFCRGDCLVDLVKVFSLEIRVGVKRKNVSRSLEIPRFGSCVLSSCFFFLGCCNSLKEKG